MLEHLKLKYSETNRPFFNIRELSNKGLFDKDEANNLFHAGKIRKRKGMHGDLIELIVKNN